MPGPHGGARPFTQEQLSVAQRVCGLRQDAYYEILEVDEQASEAEIKRAFKLLALQLHPDKNAAPGAEDAFKLVAEAYEVLGNAHDRAAYDNERRGGFAAFNPGFFTNDDRDDFEYDDPPPFRPRTPAPNETRKQRRQREYEDRQARQRAKDHAERNARRREKERRRATRFRDMEDMLRFFAGRGMHFVYCEQCDSVHVQMGDEPEEHDPPPGPRRREPHTGRDQPADAADTRARPRDNQPAFPADDVPADTEIPVPPRQQNPPRPASRDMPGSEKTSLLVECIVIALILAGVCLLAFILFKALRLVWATMKLIWTTSVGRGLLSLGLGVLYALFGPVCFAMLRHGRRGVFVIRGPGISRSGIHPVQFFTADDIFKMMPNM